MGASHKLRIGTVSFDALVFLLPVESIVVVSVSPGTVIPGQLAGDSMITTTSVVTN